MRLTLLALALTLVAGPANAERGWVPIGPNAGLGRLTSDAVADPSAPGVLHVATSAGVITSRDGGLTWAARGRGLPRDPVARLLIHPRQPRVLLALLWDERLFRSEDGGATWQQRHPHGSAGVDAVAFDPVDPAIVYASTGWTVRRSSDRGRTWTAAPLPPLDESEDVPRIVAVLAVDPTDRATVWAGTGDAGSYRSIDGGRTFAPATGSAISLALHPEERGTMLRTTGFGAVKSSDGGATWTTIIAGDWGVSHLAFDPTDGAVAYAASELGVLRSVDGGDTWNLAEVRRRDLPGVIRVVVDATALGAVYAVDFHTILHSTDAGESWATLPGPETPYVTSLALTPGRSRLLAATAAGKLHASRPGRTRWEARAGTIRSGITHLVVDPQEPATIYAAGGYVPDGPPLFRTADGGGSWQAVAGFPARTLVEGIAIDPRTPSTLWVSLRNFDWSCQLVKTTDRGVSWRPIVTAPATCLGELAVAPSNPAVLYAAMSPGVAKSVDGGEHWSSLPLDESISGVAVHPLAPSVVYAAGFDGVHRSGDGGATWQATGLEGRNIRWLVIEPRPETVYAASQTEVYRRRGESWQQLPALPDDPTIYALLRDPRRRTLFVGTLPGVWKLRAP